MITEMIFYHFMFMRKDALNIMCLIPQQVKCELQNIKKGELIGITL